MSFYVVSTYLRSVRWTNVDISDCIPQNSKREISIKALARARGGRPGQLRHRGRCRLQTLSGELPRLSELSRGPRGSRGSRGRSTGLGPSSPEEKADQPPRRNSQGQARAVVHAEQRRGMGLSPARTLTWLPPPTNVLGLRSLYPFSLSLNVQNNTRATIQV